MIMQLMLKFLFMNPVCFSSSTEGWTFQLHADLGTHSAHCAVVLSLLFCNDRCPGWGVHKLWSSAVAVSLGSRNAWFDYGYLFCIIQGGFWEKFHDFPRDWVDSDPGVNSRRLLHTWPIDYGSGLRLLVLLVMHLALCSDVAGPFFLLSLFILSTPSVSSQRR